VFDSTGEGSLSGDRLREAFLAYGLGELADEEMDILIRVGASVCLRLSSQHRCTYSAYIPLRCASDCGRGRRRRHIFGGLPEYAGPGGGERAQGLPGGAVPQQRGGRDQQQDRHKHEHQGAVVQQQVPGAGRGGGQHQAAAVAGRVVCTMRRAAVCNNAHHTLKARGGTSRIRAVTDGGAGRLPRSRAQMGTLISSLIPAVEHRTRENDIG
jgi:hypothetical protein